MSNCLGLPCGGFTNNSSYPYTGNYLGFSPSISNNCGHQQACNGCLEVIKSECIKYTGSNIVGIGVNQNDTLSEILVKLNTLKSIQDAKNTNLLSAINDINTRINTIAGGTPHAPYTLI